MKGGRLFEWLTIGLLGAGLVALKLKEVRDEMVSVDDAARGAYHNAKLSTRAENEISFSARRTTNASATVVLCHGLGATSNSMALLADQLHETQGLDVVLYDRPGYRRSRVGSPYPFVLQEAVDDLSDLVDAEVRADVPLFLIGHSLGGYLASRFASANPHRVQKLWLIEPTHPREVVQDTAKRRGVLAITEMIRMNADLAKLGLSTLKGDEGSTTAATDNPYAAQISADLDTGRTWAAMRREWNAISSLLLDGHATTPEQNAGVDVNIITSDHTLSSSSQQRALFEEYVNGDGRIHIVRNSDHQSIILSGSGSEEIARIIGLQHA